MKKSLRKWMFEILVLYLVLVGILYVAQRTLIYFPDRTVADPGAYGLEDVQIMRAETKDGLTLTGWFYPPQQEKPLIVWFHGNAGHHGYRIFNAQNYLERGYGVLLAGYRGYGGNPGKPTEEGLYQDGRAWVGALKQAGFAEDEMVLYGESLGTGVAIQMATEFPSVKALILQTPFPSLPAVAKRTYFFVPVELLMKDRFASIEKIGAINIPTMVITGEKDTITPASLGRKLFEVAQEPKSYFQVAGYGHNDLPPGVLSARVSHFLAGLASDSAGP